MRLHVAEEDGSTAGRARTPVLLLHGLTATHRYVVMGSRHLPRSGRRTLAPDARGHGASEPAPEPDAYGYDALADDALGVLDERDLQRAVVVGASMGAHTAARLALRAPERVAGLVLVTPAHVPEEPEDADVLARWRALADGLRTGGVDGFLAAYGEPRVAPALRETVTTVMRQRLGRHAHPEAVADALEVVPASRAFDRTDDLAGVAVPTAVVGSRDAADPDHPLRVAERWADVIPGAALHVEDEGASPLAWQGARLSRLVAELADRVDGVPDARACAS